jgi:hypothetical protein
MEIILLNLKTKNLPCEEFFYIEIPTEIIDKKTIKYRRFLFVYNNNENNFDKKKYLMQFGSEVFF